MEINEQLLVFRTEEQFQAYCVKWFSDEYPAERQMLHANNNNSSSRIEGNKAKATGVVPGVSDLELICDGGVTWYIELKLPGKKQSPDQIKFQERLVARKHFYVVIETFKQFKELVWQIIGR